MGFLHHLKTQRPSKYERENEKANYFAMPHI
jgi:hypothetical protein